MSGITYVRDRIVVDNAFRTEIQAELTFRKVAAGSTLYFLAREIVHAPNYTFAMSGHPLVFVADSYDGKGGPSTPPTTPPLPRTVPPELWGHPAGTAATGPAPHRSHSSPKRS
jgi:hypothetical protein